MEVLLDQMTKEEFALFLENAIAQYAEENVNAGYWLDKEAKGRSAAEFKRLLPDGLRTKDNFLLTARSRENGLKVGSVWLKVESDGMSRSGYIYQVVVDERFRGKGYGTHVMQAIEEKAKELALKSLALHVFASNPTALRLYKKSGYKVKSMNMVKDL